MSHTYPMLLDVSNRRIVIIGGGGVAVRKATGLIAAGADQVTVVAPEFHKEMPAQVQRICEPYRPEHLHNTELVFAATDIPKVNAAIVRDAHALGLLVCRADGDENEPGDFSTPALIRRSALLIAISAGGSPALAAAIRDGLEQRLDPAWEKMVEAMQVLRPMILASPKLEPAVRQAIFRDLAGSEAMAVLLSGGIDTLLNWLKTRYPGFKHA